MRLGICASLLVLAGCATYQDDLARAQKAFTDDQHERALAILRGLDGDTQHLSIGDRARYAYVRGMTDYRIGYRSEARHWLAIAVSIEAQVPQSLSAEWRQRANDALREMNEEVYTTGTQSLTNAIGSKAKESEDAGARELGPATKVTVDADAAVAAEAGSAKTEKKP